MDRNARHWHIQLPLALTAWIRRVEERGLIERFDSGYIGYRKRTPAFWRRLRDVEKLIHFMLRE